MEFRLIMRAVRRWGWLAILPAAIVTALSLPALLTRPPSGGFAMSITYSAAPPYEALPRTEGDYQDIWLSSELTVNAFTDWVKGSRFRDEVFAAVDDSFSLEPSAFGIAADNARSVGRIDLSYPDAEALRALGAAVIEVLSTRSGEYFAQLGGQAAVVTILSESPVASSPPPLGDRITPLLRIGLAVLIGMFLVALAYALDPFVHCRDDVNAVGLSVICTIPRR